MKQGQSTKRPRGHRGNGRRPSGGGGRNSNFESSGPQGKIRGTAYQVIEKYQALGRDALTFGDRVAAENYFQHAEHYYRVMVANGGLEQRGGTEQRGGAEQSGGNDQRDGNDQRGGRNQGRPQNRPPQQQGQQPRPQPSAEPDNGAQAEGLQAESDQIAASVTHVAEPVIAEPVEAGSSEEVVAEPSEMDGSPA